MDQIKIGKFIAELRKEQNLTQKELAEKLNLSDKTVSKWECGKGLPDNSIMITLCDLMDISVNELLSGERLSTVDYNKKAEENIINLIQESTKTQEKQKWDALIKIVGELSLVLIMFFSFLTFGGIDTLYRFFDIPSFVMVTIFLQRKIHQALYKYELDGFFLLYVTIFLLFTHSSLCFSAL